MKGGQGDFPVSETLPAAAQLPEVGGLVAGFERVHVGVLVALLATIAIRYLLESTKTGYEVTVTGSNAEAAAGSGIDVEWVCVLVFVFGGVLAGVADAIESAGVQARLRPNFSPGYGFTAIPIALLGRRGALRVFLAGLFLPVLVVGGSSRELAFEVPAAIVEVIQALVILFLITAEFFKRYRITVERDGSEPPATGATGYEVQ